MGLNLLEGERRDGGVWLEAGMRWTLDAGPDAGPDAGSDAAPAGPVYVAVAPRHVRLVTSPDATGSPANRVTAAIATIDLERDRALVRLGGPIPLSVEVDPGTALGAGLRVGDVVSVDVDPARFVPTRAV